MTPTLIFYAIISILLLDFLADTVLEYLNARHLGNPIPGELADVYDEAEYKKSQTYQKINYRFGLLTSAFSLVVTLGVFFLNGFRAADAFARSLSDNSIIIALFFFGVILLGSNLLEIPLSYYHTFVMEEKFGFNKTTRKTFFADILKSWLLTAILGGAILTLIMLFYKWAGRDFWWYAWGLVGLFGICMSLFYTKIIVPLFNKQIPLESGSLKTQIEKYVAKTGFRLDKIYVIDGSKRSTKANAYFSGFGSQKRITLYDTLLKDLEEPEIVAVLAHEIGHYKRHHLLYNLLVSGLLTGAMLYILSLFLAVPEVSLAIGVQTASFHAGLIAFGILYSPISELTGVVVNFISRRFEYQADAYARTTFNGDALVLALKKLSKNSLSNLTPHPVYVFVHYSHPTLGQRIRRIKA